MRISDWSSDVCSSDLSVQDVPIAISAFNTEMVEASGTTNITSLNGLAPNVVLQTQGLVANVPMISIRGMSTADPDPNADPKVSTIINGVYISFVSSTMLDLFDVERLEVLTVPQGGSEEQTSDLQSLRHISY